MASKHHNPLDFHHEKSGFTCPECGNTLVTDDADFYVWCISKGCNAYALLLEASWKER